MTSPSKRTQGTPIDWTVVRARVENAAARLRESLHSDETWSREILERRARLLARPLAANASAGATMAVVAFELAGQTFGLEAVAVRATVRPRGITPLPGLPASVSGVVNVRGQVVAAFDLRPLLQLPAAAASESPTLVIAVHEGTEFGLLADRILPSRDLPMDNLRRDIPGLSSKYVRGLSPDGLLLLDLPALFADLALNDAPQG